MLVTKRLGLSVILGLLICMSASASWAAEVLYSDRGDFNSAVGGQTVINFEGYCADDWYLWFHNQSISGVLFQGHGGYVWNNFPNLHIFGPDLFPPEKPTDWNSGCVLVGPADGWIYADLPVGTKAFGTDVMTYRIDQWGPNETVLAATYGFHAHAWVKYGDGSDGFYYWNPTFQRPNRAFWGLVSDKEIDWVAMWSTTNQSAYIVWDNVTYSLIPEPSGLAALSALLGSAGLFVIRKKSR